MSNEAFAVLDDRGADYVEGVDFAWLFSQWRPVGVGLEVQTQGKVTLGRKAARLGQCAARPSPGAGVRLLFSLQPAKGAWPGAAAVCGLQDVTSHFFDTLRVVLVADG